MQAHHHFQNTFRIKRNVNLRIRVKCHWTKKEMRETSCCSFTTGGLEEHPGGLVFV